MSGCIPAVQGLIRTPTQPPTATTVPTVTPTATITPSPTATATPTLVPTATQTPTPTPAVLVGAGDISVCGNTGDQETAALLAEIPGAIFTAGDNSNDYGRQVEYENCFGPTWGQFLDRIHPSPGNHDYENNGGKAYYSYFGAAAGERGKGWYSYDLGAWHIVALNTNCNDVSCWANSKQVQWLRQNLQSHPTQCSLAYYHIPRWSSGEAGSATWISAIFTALWDNGVDVVVSGHDHEYERIAPQDPDGNLDKEHGVRQFVVGTGGAFHRPFTANILPNSEVRIADTFGVIQFTLYEDHYDWAFLPVGGGPALDSGSEECR